MADVLTHVLVAYVIATLLSWRYEWFSPALVTAVMAGALLPDLVKIRLVLPSDTVSAMLGIPFNWAPFHKIGGIVAVIAIITVIVPRAMRAATFISLSMGSFEHLLLDSFLYWPDGLASPMLWPISDFQFAVDGFYKSWDRWPLAITLALVVLVFAASRYRDSRPEDRPDAIPGDAIPRRESPSTDRPTTPGVSVDGYGERGGQPGD